MKRRELLKLGAASAVGAFGALTPSLLSGGQSAHATPRSPFIILPIYDDDPLTLEGRQRSILIVGGGLAGLSAALELAERGYQVTLREAGDERSIVSARHSQEQHQHQAYYLGRERPLARLNRAPATNFIRKIVELALELAPAAPLARHVLLYCGLVKY